eukprot:jgi/Ulvmu1/12184/UM085_0048.1
MHPLQNSVRWPTHAQGFMQVQEQWQGPLMHAGNCIKQALHAAGFMESQLLGLYVRGSLPQGRAVEHVSDIDLSAYVLSATTQDDCMYGSQRVALAEQLRMARARAVANFDFVVKAGASTFL